MSTTNWNSTPANIAAATAVGIFSMADASGRIKAVITINNATKRKAPTPSAIVIPLDPAMKAAPGVDHAVTIGVR